MCASVLGDTRYVNVNNPSPLSWNNHAIEAFFIAYPDTNGYTIAQVTRAALNSLVLSWTAANGWLYTLQQTPTLTPAAWSNVPPYANMAGQGKMTITNELGAAPRMFYRLIATE